jgi:hypothetical protein
MRRGSTSTAKPTHAPSSKPGAAVCRHGKRKRLLELREEVTAKAAELTRKAIEALKKRGYDMRGKTIAEMKKIIRRPLTEPKSDG